MLLAIILFLILFILDQLSKYLTEKYIAYEEVKTFIPKFLKFSYVENKGMAWSLFSDEQWPLVIISIIGTILILYGIFKLLDFRNAKLLSISLVLALAGCFGNLYDRLIAVLSIDGARLGVVDMIQFEPFDLLCRLLNLGTTTFNLADAYLVIGVIGIMIDFLLLKDKRDEKLGRIKRKKLK